MAPNFSILLIFRAASDQPRATVKIVRIATKVTASGVQLGIGIGIGARGYPRTPATHRTRIPRPAALAGCGEARIRVPAPKIHEFAHPSARLASP
jgi:hypothetical protein